MAMRFIHHHPGFTPCTTLMELGLSSRDFSMCRRVHWCKLGIWGGFTIDVFCFVRAPSPALTPCRSREQACSFICIRIFFHFLHFIFFLITSWIVAFRQVMQDNHLVVLCKVCLQCFCCCSRRGSFFSCLCGCCFHLFLFRSLCFQPRAVLLQSADEIINGSLDQSNIITRFKYGVWSDCHVLGLVTVYSVIRNARASRDSPSE